MQSLARTAASHSYAIPDAWYLHFCFRRLYRCRGRIYIFILTIIVIITIIMHETNRFKAGDGDFTKFDAVDARAVMRRFALDDVAALAVQSTKLEQEKTRKKETMLKQKVVYL